MTRRWLDQVEALAREALPEPVFHYVAEGARDEISVGEAVAAWQSIRVAPRILRDVSHVENLDRSAGCDVRPAPGYRPDDAATGGRPGRRGGDGACGGRGRCADGRLQQLREHVQRHRGHWSLLVAAGPPSDRRDDALPLLHAAVAAGAAAVVLTADTPVLGTRYPLPDGPHVWDMADPTWLNANAPVTSGLHPEDRAKAMDLGPTDVAWLAETTGLPVVVKGVLRADDAGRCADAGAGAVWISNHGGRQLDQAVATAGCVAAVRAAVPSGVKVYVDGGLRAGLHVMLAAALGADAAFVGRPMFYALAAGGEQGALGALEGRCRACRVDATGRLSDTRGHAGDPAPTSRRGAPKGR